MWRGDVVKSRAKKIFRQDYWRMVLVSLILTLVASDENMGPTIRRIFSEDTASAIRRVFVYSYEIGYMRMTMLAILTIVLIISFFVFAPLQVGAERFFVVSHYQKARLSELGYAFSHSYLKVVKTIFFKALYTTLWSLLLVIPGIIKSYEYRMIPYILADDPEISTEEAFDMSKRMMDGNKWAVFVLDLSFLGWVLLSILTLGILAIFYVSPYIDMTGAELYVELKGRHSYTSEDNEI